MASFKTAAIAVLTATAIGSAALVTPAFAEQRKVGFDASRLDKAPADYSQYYRRGWHRGGNRGAAIAAGVGLGVLGAAAIAANRRAYADPYYNDGYYDEPGYGYAPVYAEPPVVYAPRARYYAPRYGYGYIPDNIRDPAGGSYR
ncbi:hypothetical protein DWF00_22755 [Bosea caraganae]|uniref:BA14K family protein n=1 Tax=Bosea caraganae TaxID=2763117 RepID=A0A370L1N3_9HYPH|nr:hypothetical protein [Bosea caraganae]RDJ21479.1 hypothetical protein DWE98_20820 [Bosea caraganae]RDJ23447.1 hypothetical protein DWF00_22755 [Bosea caraganae]